MNLNICSLYKISCFRKKNALVMIIIILSLSTPKTVVQPPIISFSSCLYIVKLSF